MNQYGFVEAPYRVLDKTDPANPVVTDDVVYLTADEEDNYVVAQANEPLDEEGHFVPQQYFRTFPVKRHPHSEAFHRLNGRIPEDGILRSYFHDSVPGER